MKRVVATPGSSDVEGLFLSPMFAHVVTITCCILFMLCAWGAMVGGSF